MLVMMVLMLLLDSFVSDGWINGDGKVLVEIDVMKFSDGFVVLLLVMFDVDWWVKWEILLEIIFGFNEVNEVYLGGELFLLIFFFNL